MKGKSRQKTSEKFDIDYGESALSIRVVEHGESICKMSTANAHNWPKTISSLPKTICSYFSGIHMTFVIISSFWTKLRYTKTRLGSKNFSWVLGTVFLDCQVIIFVTYLEKDRSITGALYTSLVNRFKIELQQKTRTSSIFHHVNVLAHSFGIPLNQIRLPPSQHYLFHHMENQWMMTRKKYYPNKDVISILLFERDQQ